MPAGTRGRANLGELVAGHQPGGIDELARRQVEIDEGEVEISVRMQGRRREANLDLLFQVDARRALDLIEPEVVGAQRRAGPIVAARVVQRHVGLELARPRQEVGFIDPVFDDPSELGVVWAPAALRSHTGKSDSRPLPCPCPHPDPPPQRGEGENLHEWSDYEAGMPSSAAGEETRVAACAPLVGGRRRTKVLPLPSSLNSSLSEPPCRSASSRLMKSPNPVPGCGPRPGSSMRKKRSKTLSCFSRAIPMPRSSMISAGPPSLTTVILTQGRPAL